MIIGGRDAELLPVLPPVDVLPFPRPVAERFLFELDEDDVGDLSFGKRLRADAEVDEVDADAVEEGRSGVGLGSWEFSAVASAPDDDRVVVGLGSVVCCCCCFEDKLFPRLLDGTLLPFKVRPCSGSSLSSIRGMKDDDVSLDC